MNIGNPTQPPQPLLASLSPTFKDHITPDVLVAHALSSLPGFEAWAHQPAPSSVESLLLEFDEQQLMTTAAVCLLRLAKLHLPTDNADAA